MSTLSWKQNLVLDAHDLRPATAADAAGLAALMAEPEVAQWWHQDWDVKRWTDYLRRMTEDPGSLPLALDREGRVTGYVEIYRVATDVLGDHIEHSESDLGMHIAVGRQSRGRGLGTGIIRGVLREAIEILDGCPRLVAEPDIRNISSHRAFSQAGFASFGTVQLPDKVARLMAASTDTRPQPARFSSAGGATRKKALL
ncbi:RimJ/RimL family protein N-acetyltransferase [Arthrobacter sp. CAN_A214]|uniref:GNAT family N-acetyltransferase n=1 Tax=Arthrobacter sp. CAN_A214 TaxID=2787720 RepID=UPI0018CBECB3